MKYLMNCLWSSSVASSTSECQTRKLPVLKVLTGAVLSLVANTALGSDDIRLGIPSYGGNGCPRGSASASLSPDRKSLSILFDQYIAEAGEYAGKRVDRKSCNLSIPVRVPQGYSLSIIKVDYRGFVSVPRGGRAQFNAEYFFAGARGPKRVATFRGPTDEEYAITDPLLAEAVVWTPCGADTNLRVNSSMMAVAGNRGEDTLATVDSADVNAGVVYHLQWRRCR